MGATTQGRRGRQGRQAIRCGLLMMTTALGTVGLTAYAQAQDQTAAPAGAQAETLSFDIPSQPLVDALALFGRQSGMQVSVDAALIRGKVSPGVSGPLAPEQALRRILSGTGVTYRLTDGNTAMLEVVSTSDGATLLDPITVEGRGEAGPHAQIGYLPPDYAGGQVARGSRIGLMGSRDLFDTPFSTKAYTEQTIENQQASRIIDVVENDASVNVNLGRYSGNDQFHIRGFPIFNSDLMVDGLPGLTAGRATPIAGFERVELIKGPNAMLSGANVGGTVAGTVNLVPKRAGRDPLTRLTADYEGDSIVGGQADLSRRFGPEKSFGARINVSHRQGDTPVDLQGIRSTEFAGGFDYLGDRFRASLDLGHVDEKIDAFSANIRANPGFALPDAPDATSNPKQPWEVQDDDFYYGLAAAEYDITDDWTGGIRYGRSYWEEDLFATSIIRLSNSNGDFSSRAFVANMYSDSETAEATLRGTATTGAVEHEIALQAAGTWIESGSVTNVISGVTVTSNIFGPIRIDRPDRPDADASKTSETTLESFALSDTLSTLNDHLLVTLGARHQTVQTEGFDPTTGARTSNVRQSEVTPAVGIVVKPVDRLSIYGNYIEALTQGPSAPLGTANYGEVLDPIMTEQVEIGAKWDTGNFGVTAALFQITQPSALTDPGTNIHEIAGEQRNRGVELEVFGEPTEGVRLLGGITYTDGQLTETVGGLNDGNTAVGVPEVQVRASAEWDVPTIDGMTLIGRGLYASSQYLDAGNTQDIPGWMRFDLGARYSFDYEDTAITARLNVENVAGNNYWQSTGRSFLSKGQPRTVLFSVAADF